MQDNTFDERRREPKQRLTERARELLKRTDGAMPVWIRPPITGMDFWCGLTRAKLYVLAAQGNIRSVSLREPGQIRGCRLFHLKSIFDYFERCERGTEKPKPTAGRKTKGRTKTTTTAAGGAA